jgi:hypothetical protein
MSERPCRFCIAYHGEYADAEMCEMAHRLDNDVCDLARALARVFQGNPAPPDEQIGWFLEDAEAIIDDFQPRPERWRVRKLPDSDDEFVARFRINDVTYVIQNGEGYCPPERLSEYRAARSS